MVKFNDGIFSRLHTVTATVQRSRISTEGWTSAIFNISTWTQRAS